MSSWRIKPDEVIGVLSAVQTDADAIGGELADARFQSVLDGLTWAGQVTGDVPGAVNALFHEQTTNLANIAHRVQAGAIGVANAVTAYRNGQEEMAGTYQAELLRSARSGDFTFFVQHGQQV